MKTIDTLAAGALAIASIVPLGAAKTDAGTGRPNVLFIISDDLLPRLNCYGRSGMVTPNIDRLARQGRVFENAYAQVPLCGPSRASFLTGLRPESTRCFGNHDLVVRKKVPGLVTLPQYFKNNGYVAFSIGKVYHDSKVQPGEDRESWSDDPFPPAGGTYFNKETKVITNKLRAEWEAKGRKGAIASGVPYEVSAGKDEEFRDGVTATRAIEKIREFNAAPAADRKPFFLAVGFSKPHIPFSCPKKYWDIYDPAKIELEESPLPAAVNEWMTEGPKEFIKYYGMPKDGKFSPELQRTLIHAYSACVSFMDAQVGRVLEALDREGIADNTIIVFIGDNGYHLGDHATWGKWTNFESGTHVPLIIRAPQVRDAGAGTKEIAEFLDIAPTLTELAGLPAYEKFEGKSLVNVLKYPAAKTKGFAISQVERDRSTVRGYAIRTPEYRYVEWRRMPEWQGDAPKLIATELYDHRSDPDESVNVAKKHPQVCRELSQRLPQGWADYLVYTGINRAPARPKAR